MKLTANTSNNDTHERARKLIALAGPGMFSADSELSSNVWLVAHLESCPSCRSFAENASETVHSLRAIPIAAERSLVLTTQTRVRHRALELQRHRERLWLVAISCTAVTLGAVVSTFALWRGFEWLGARAQLASPVWQVGLLSFCMTPALVAAILLLVKDSGKNMRLSDRDDSYRTD